MLHENKHVEKVTDVIQVMHAGIEFYRDALKEVENESIKAVFRKMIAGKETAIESLQPLAIAEQGEREEGSSIAVDSRKLYTKVASMFSSNEDYTYVKQLEEVEDKVLDALDDALDEDQPADALALLRDTRANAQQLHDEMKSMQKMLKK